MQELRLAKITEQITVKTHCWTTLFVSGASLLETNHTYPISCVQLLKCKTISTLCLIKSKTN